MKFSENSLVVDVIKISNSSYKLSVPAGDLLAAAMNGAVLRRHDLSTAAVPNVLYVPLSEAKLSSGTYTFTFASGDAFTASAADAYPAASSVSDKTDSELPDVGTNDKGKFLHTNESTGALEWAEGGSGGGVLVVTFTNPNNFPKKADYTFEEIKSAYDNGSVLLAKSDTSGSMLGQLGYSEAPQGGLASFSGLVMRAAATRIFIDEVKISSDNSVTSTQKQKVEYDT